MQLCSVYINIDIYPYFNLFETSSCHAKLFFLNEWVCLHNNLSALYCRKGPEGNVCVYESVRWRNLRKDGFCCFTACQVLLVQEKDEDKMNVAHGIHVRKYKCMLSFG